MATNSNQIKEKEFKDYDEMIDLLKSRNVCIDTSGQRRSAKIILQRNGYYNVINGYKFPFLTSTPPNPEKYKTGTTVNELFAVYAFDRSIREIFLRNILHVETNVKNLISYRISSKYGHDNYLLYKNFDTASKDANNKITKLFATIQNQIASHSYDPNIAHYLKNHGYIPMWVLNSILSFGTMSKFYSLMKQQDRQYVSKIFNLQDNTLGNFLGYLTSIRNFCAHGNRLYCFTSSIPLADTKVHKNLSITQDKGHYINGRNDLFGAVIILRYLLSAKEYRRFISELNGAINKLSSKLVTISIDEILKIMGFPQNWKNIKTKSIML